MGRKGKDAGTAGLNLELFLYMTLQISTEVTWKSRCPVAKRQLWRAQPQGQTVEQDRTLGFDSLLAASPNRHIYRFEHSWFQATERTCQQILRNS